MIIIKKPFVFRRLLKTKSLRLINLLGLTLIFTSIFVSYSYICWETGFDKFYSKADNIGRLSLSFEGKQADGRIFTDTYDPIITEMSGVEDVLKLSIVETATLTSRSTKIVVNHLALAGLNFFDFFYISLIHGDSNTVFNAPDKVLISEKLALQLYGSTDVVGRPILLDSRKYVLEKGFINGVFRNIPENSHLHTDVIVSKKDFSNLIVYYYLLKRNGVDLNNLSSEISLKIQSSFDDPVQKTTEASIMPLTDIHLHSNVAKEIELGGNIDYIYLIAGANILLFIIVLFNLWLNSSVIFSYNKRYYQLLRLNGASSIAVLKDEFQVSICICVVSLFCAFLLSLYIPDYFDLNFQTDSLLDQLLLSIVLLVISIFVSLLPVFRSISVMIFFNRNESLKPVKFSFSNVKYMLVVQYTIVIFIIIVAVAINNQISVIRTHQIGATNDSIIVLKEQPNEVKNNYSLLKTELLRHPEIKNVTGVMQLPGEAIRDMTQLQVEDKADIITSPILVVGNDFFSFFGIKPIAGSLPPQLTLSQQEESVMFDQKVIKELYNEVYSTSQRDNYIINRKALSLLGFSSAEEALGKEITILHQSLNYIPGGKICGVVDDFVYTNVYEDATPMLIIQRNLFMNCFMVRLSPQHTEKALSILDNEWNKVNAGFPLNYAFLKDHYQTVYRNELNAEQMVKLFSILCLAITILGLIVFMAFMVKMRNREIGIRKVNGASHTDIIYLLNKSLLIWMVLSCIIAIPFSIYIMDMWLSNFAYRTVLTVWIFVGACISVILFSLIAVSWQSRQAAKINPIDVIKSE